ncbi:MAG: Hsp20/alpha crystallin family protein [Candidatus Hodarchaeales archaeon]
MNKNRRNFDDIWNFGFDEIFNSIEEEFKALMNNNLSEYQEGGPITFGYSMKIGPDTNYQPEIRQWGNFNDYRKKNNLPELGFPVMERTQPALTSGSNDSELFYDFVEDGDYLKVIVEVPGFTKKDLSVDINEKGTEITIKGKTETREVNQSISLPSKIEPKTTKSSVTNGILEIKGKKLGDSSKKIKLKIE